LKMYSSATALMMCLRLLFNRFLTAISRLCILI
jgi:Histidinol-phosphate/aromatic aminotransferase and cobyric acid decarboxylase